MQNTLRGVNIDGSLAMTEMEQYLKVTTSSDDDVFIVLPWVDVIFKHMLLEYFFYSALHICSGNTMFPCTQFLNQIKILRDGNSESTVYYGHQIK